MSVSKYLGLAEKYDWLLPNMKNTFRPDAPITRGDAVELIMHILDPEMTNPEKGFVDLSGVRSSMKKAIILAQSFSIVQGEAGVFSPDVALKR